MLSRTNAPCGAGRAWRPMGGLVLAATLLLAGCAAERAYQSPGFPFAPGWRSAAGGAPVLLGNAEWWRGLGDPVLDRLMAQALDDSLTLAAARARVIAAQAERDTITGAPQFAPSMGIEAGKGGTLAGNARLGLDWLLDPWGARAETRRAAAARADAAAADAAAAQLLVLFNTANAYLDLRYRERLMALRRDELRSRRETLALIRRMADGGAATRLEITRSAARVAEIEAQLPGLEAAIAAKRNEIAVLVGTAPGGIETGRGGSIPRPTLSPEVGIPADLLRNRPDILAAERRYYAALADLGAAEAARYPRLSLSGAISITAIRAGRDLTQAHLGPLVQLPAIPGTATEAAVEARRAAVTAAHADWTGTVLSALAEVENALLDYGAASRSLRAAGRAAELHAEARRLTREVFEARDATLGDLIDAEQAVSAAADRLAETLYRRAQSFVALNIRLGSGHAVPAGRPRP